MIAAALLGRSTITSINNAAGKHMDGAITRIAEVELTERHLMVTAGTDPSSQVRLCGAQDDPIGVAYDACDAGDTVGIQHPGSAQVTRLCVASVAITAGERIYTDADGMVTNVAATGSYLVGRALTDASELGDEVEFDPAFPVVTP